MRKPVDIQIILIPMSYEARS